MLLELTVKTNSDFKSKFWYCLNSILVVFVALEMTYFDARPALAIEVSRISADGSSESS